MTPLTGTIHKLARAVVEAKQVADTAVAVEYATKLIKNAPAALKTRNLQVVDRAMGPDSKTFGVPGELRSGKTVVDLGANC
jgi:hypothetical protein